MIAQHFIYENYKPETLMDPFNEAVAIWKKNGDKEVSLWRLKGAKIGHFGFSVRYETMVQIGNCMDNLAEDTDFAARRIKYHGTFLIKENIIGRMIAEGLSKNPL